LAGLTGAVGPARLFERVIGVEMGPGLDVVVDGTDALQAGGDQLLGRRCSSSLILLLTQFEQAVRPVCRAALEVVERPLIQSFHGLYHGNRGTRVRLGNPARR